MVRFDFPRLKIVADPSKPAARTAATKLQKYKSKNPNLIAVFGGDGFMIRTLHRYHELGLPFIGFNVGHTGFLMNDLNCIEDGELHGFEILTHPILQIKATSPTGEVTEAIAFNDAWVERVNSQAVLFQVLLNGRIQTERLMGDGILVSTTLGSTGYARAMGMDPMPNDANVLVFAGSNICDPIGFRGYYPSIKSRIELRSLEKQKRPARAQADGKPLGRVERLEIRVHPTATFQLGFFENESLEVKLSRTVFQCKVR